MDESGDRIEAPLVRDGAKHVAVDWDTALDRFGQMLRGGSGSAVVLASGRASTESLGLVRRLLDRFDVTAAVQVPLGQEAPLPGIPGLALRRERAPNLAGAELLGYTAKWEAALGAAASASVVVVLDAELSAADESALAGIAGSLVVLGTVATDWLHRADLVLPVTNMAEETART